jgi:predicted nucleotidyltransferase
MSRWQLVAPIPGLPAGAQQKLAGVFDAEPKLKEVWLYGSRAMGRERPGSDVDLCLTGEALGHGDLLRMMACVDDLLLPWQVDLTLRHQLPPDMLEHINRVGRCIWRPS